MEKHYELKEDKLLFLLKLWCREHNVEFAGVKMLSPAEALQYINERTEAVT